MTPANPTREGDAMGTCPTEKMKNLQATIEPGPVIAISRKKGGDICLCLGARRCASRRRRRRLSVFRCPT